MVNYPGDTDAMRLKILALLAYLTVSVFAQSKDELRRQAYLGVSLRIAAPAGSGAEVRKVEASSVADRPGLKSGDHILEINGTRLDSRKTLNQVLRSLHGGDHARFKLTRAGKEAETTAILEALPSENLQGVEIIHDSVQT